MSAERFLKDAPKDKYHLVYIDPPYDFSNQAVVDVLSALHDYEFLNSDAFIAVEFESTAKSDHSVLTEQRQELGVQRVIGFLKSKLL